MTEEIELRSMSRSDAAALFILARRALHTAYVWNDHNFGDCVKLARGTAEEAGLKDLEEANAFIERLTKAFSTFEAAPPEELRKLEYCLMPKNLIRLNGQQDLRFRGEKLGEVTELLGDVSRLTLSLFRTGGGQYVCVREEVNLRTEKLEAEVAPDHKAVFRFFRFTDLAKSLYEACGVDAVRTVQ